MAREAREFWAALERGLPDGGPERRREIAKAVLLMLRRRIRPEEALHVRAALPDDLKGVWSERGIGVAEEHTARPIEELDHNEFVDAVRRMAGLSGMKEAARATGAVFTAVRRVLPERERYHVERQLPAGLKELWRGDHEDRGPHRELGPSPYWALLDDRLEGRVPASAPEITCSVLAHLRGRLSPRVAANVGGGLPAELREYWVAPEAGTEAPGPPERFAGRIAQDLGLGNLDEARHAAAAVFGALRRTLPEKLARQVEQDLPEELRGLWRGM